jgi:hypothetical protein
MDEKRTIRRKEELGPANVVEKGAKVLVVHGKLVKLRETEVMVDCVFGFLDRET